MSTDAQWEAWGSRDPYFGVITDPRYRLENLTDAARAEFFASGVVHAAYVMEMIRRHVEVAFRPRRALDFGCGVGRVLVALGNIVPEVVGADVSRSMLDEARRNCERAGVPAQLVASDDALAGIEGTFDLVHSYIVFQHIPAARGMTIFRALLQRIGPDGVGAIHVTYSKQIYEAEHGALPPRPMHDLVLEGPATALRDDPPRDPEMQMNPYPMNELLFALQAAGVHRFHAEFTDHGGELGVMLFFRRAAA